MNAGLAEKMLAYADKNNLPEDDKMRILAKEFDTQIRKFIFGEGDVKSVVGSWARARRYWCSVSGESLV